MNKLMVSKVDNKILEILQQDVRTPISKIAKEVGLSENGVRYRLEKLEKEGYIKSYTILLNPRKFGKKLLAIFNLEVEPKVMGRHYLNWQGWTSLLRYIRPQDSSRLTQLVYLITKSV